MSEQQTDAPATESPADQVNADPKPETFDADYVAKLRKEAADYRTKAKANADAAARLAAIEEAQKSEADKTAEALAAARNEAEHARAELLRYRAAAEHGITDADDIELFLTGRDEETLTRQAKALSARIAASTGPRAPKPDANQGRSGSGGPKSTTDSFAEFFRSSLPER